MSDMTLGRLLVAAFAASLCCVGGDALAVRAQSSKAAPAAPKLTYAFELHATVAAPTELGQVPNGRRRIIDITGGTVEGQIKGKVRPGGADWQIVRADGAILLDARVVLRTYDGAEIAMEYTGIRTGPADIIARLGRGEPVDPADYYFRIAPRFSTSDPRYEWLNRIMTVGIGHRLPEGPVYSVFEIV